MPTSLVSTGVQFPDSTIQTTAASGGYSVLLSNTFTSSGTYNKSSGTSNDTVIITVVGAGGGGATGFYANTDYFLGACGGSGGGYTTVAIPYDIVPNTVAVTIGAGGAGGIGGGAANTANSGFMGGNTFFQGFAIALGGQGGRASACTGIGQVGRSIGIANPGGIAYGGLLGNANTNAIQYTENTFGNLPPLFLPMGGRATDSACTSPLFIRIFPGDTGGGGMAVVNSNSTITFFEGGTGRAIGDGGNSLGANGGTGAGGAANVGGNGGNGGDGIVIVRVVSGSMSAEEYKRKSNTYSGVTVSY